MTTKIFVNLPVKNLEESKVFFSKLGFEFDAKFSDENGCCMIINENAFVMLLVEKFFKTFTKKELGDASKTTEVITALSATSREKVDELVDKALKEGGKVSNETTDMGWMYQRSFQDLDGHLWEVAYMDESAFAAQQG